MLEHAIRPATEDDVDFLVESALEADKSGTSISSYRTLFDLEPDEARSVLREVLLSEIDGHELSLSSALVAEAGGRPVASVSAWVEGEHGASTLLKATVLFGVLGRDRTAEAKPRLALLAPLAIPRKEGAVQLESIYVRADARGHGLVAALVERHLAALGPRAAAGAAQIMLAGNNQRARRAYEKLGFSTTTTRTAEDPRVAELLPDSSRIMMEKSLRDDL